MSDCSTRAFEVPDCPDPKTCGNCGHSCGHKAKLDGCRGNYVPCLLFVDFEHENNFCSDWKPRTEIVEQRYQQLERVAKDLYNAAWCAWFLKTNGEMPELDKEMKERVADSYLQNEKDQLEALGVNLDD